jgi:hypothetical protein
MKCYRYRAIPDEYRQSYASFAPEDGVCRAFARLWPDSSVVPEADLP